jgi:hypothetical protein
MTQHTALRWPAAIALSLACFSCAIDAGDAPPAEAVVHEPAAVPIEPSLDAAPRPSMRRAFCAPPASTAIGAARVNACRPSAA